MPNYVYIYIYTYMHTYIHTHPFFQIVNCDSQEWFVEPETMLTVTGSIIQEDSTKQAFLVWLKAMLQTCWWGDSCKPIVQSCPIALATSNRKRWCGKQTCNQLSHQTCSIQLRTTILPHPKPGEAPAESASAWLAASFAARFSPWARKGCHTKICPAQGLQRCGTGTCGPSKLTMIRWPFLNTFKRLGIRFACGVFFLKTPVE